MKINVLIAYVENSQNRNSQNSKPHPPLCVSFLARIYKGLKKYLIDYYLYIMYIVGRGHYFSFENCDFANSQRCGVGDLVFGLGFP